MTEELWCPLRGVGVPISECVAACPAPEQREVCAMEMNACAGWPDGRICLSRVAADRILCQECVARRQEATATDPPADLSSVGLILEDLDAPRLECPCGGDPEGYRHESSLLHLRMEYADRQRVDGARSSVKGWRRANTE